MSANIETIRTKDKLMITIPTKDMNAEEIDDLLSFLKMKIAVHHSKMTADEIKANQKIGGENCF